MPTKAKSQTQQFEACADAGFTIIPLSGKKPIDANWTRRQYDNAATLARIRREGLNAGLRLPENVFVFDPDVLDRDGNRGLEAYIDLCLAVGFDDAAFHRVRTGSGGLHVYGAIPPGFKTRTQLGFPGVQVRRHGNQTVLPGSVHPTTGKLYRFEDDSPNWRTPLKPFPPCVLELIAAPEKSERQTIEGGIYPAEQCAALLAKLNPEDFREYDKWLALGMAVYHASAGEALDVWLEWCERDPAYAHARDENEAKWETFGGEGISYQTLDWHVRKVGGADVLAQVDFQSEPVDCNLPDADPTESFKRYTDGPKRGKIVADSQDNIRLALRLLGAKVSYNLFSDKIVIEGLKAFGPHLDDAAIDRLWLTVDAMYHFRPTLVFFDTVVRDAARRNSFHPVREYLAKVQSQWDGKPRLDMWLHTYAGAADTPYTRAVGTLPLIAAVRRVRQPGAKYDEIVVLESGQGKEKSTALEVLAVDKDWFTDSLPLNADGKRVIEAISGKWIIECADLHGLSRANVDAVKAMLSRTVDRARMSYGRNPVERPRQNVIFGTANSQDYLRDKTGNRRFWPVAVKAFDIAALRRDVHQLWGEAATRETRGQSIRLDRALWAAAGAEQERRIDAATDPYTDALRAVLGDMTGKISSEAVWQILGLKTAGLRTQDQNDRMGKAMKYLGWKRKRVWISGGAKPGYVRGPQPFKQIVVSHTSNDAIAFYEDEIEESE